MFMETSAKAGHNVKSLFKKIAMSLPGMEKEGQADSPNTSRQHLVFSSRPGLTEVPRDRRYDVPNTCCTRGFAMQLLTRSICVGPCSVDLVCIACRFD